MRPLLLASFLLAAAWGLAVPAALILTLRQRWGMSWRVIGRGALVFLVFQVLTRLPTMAAAEFLLRERLEASSGFRVAWLAVAALTAGVFEEVGRYVGYRWWVPEARRWRDGVAFGLGHGGLEMFLLGGLGGLAATLGYVVYSQYGAEARVPAALEPGLAAARQLYATMPTGLPLLGAFERTAALAIQIALSLMVLRVFQGGGPVWLALAVACHAAVDATALGAFSSYGPVVAEAVIGVFAAGSLWLVWRWREPNADDRSGNHSPTTARAR
jgi:uncharacterized membrane protein YhfC